MSFIKRLSVEIAKSDEHPHYQATFAPVWSCCASPSVSKVNLLNSYANRIVTKSGKGRTRVFLSMLLKEEDAVQVKAWAMFCFSEFLDVVFEDGGVQRVDCTRDRPAEEFEGLKYGVVYDRVATWTPPDLPLSFNFGENSIELNESREDLTRIILYRKKDLKELELAFIWRRNPVPKGYYCLELLLMEGTRPTLVIDLTRLLGEIWRGVKKTRRAEIRAGLTKTNQFTDPPKDVVRQFLVFEDKCRREIGINKLNPELLKEGHIHVACDKHGRILAGFLTHVRGNSLCLRRAASEKGYAYAHAALTWHVIEWARQMGFKEFDQGGYNVEKYPEVSFWKSRFGGKACRRPKP